MSVSKAKLMLFSLIATAFFIGSLELAVRLFLYVETRDVKLLRYGLINELQRERCVNVYDTDGRKLYHKLVPSQDPKNPINSDGFRGHEILEKQTGITRIVCLGGSTTYGLTLDYKDSYPKLLQEMLDTKAGEHQYEVINAGIPAIRLSQINALVEREIIKLKPDIIILMSVFNNLVTEDQNFLFTTVEGEEKNLIVRTCRKLVKKVRDRLLFVAVIDDIVKKGFRDYLQTINWRAAAAAIMASESVWKNFTNDLTNFFSLLFNNNPSLKIIVLDEAVNQDGYPETAETVHKATLAQWETCRPYKNIIPIKISDIIRDAQLRGEQVWLAPYMDPVHLSRRGNEIIAAVLADHIMSQRLESSQRDQEGLLQ